MTAPTITYRSDTGRDLQASEIDGNFRNLATAIVGLQTNPTLPDSIASITVSGSSMTITLTSGAVLGPFVLPTLMFRWRGTYDAGANYATMDVFTVAQQGIYVVLKPFSAATVFDGPTLLGAGFIQQLFGAVDASLSGLSDVQITALAAGQVIEWNATDQKWENVTLGSMAAQNANAVAITGGSISNAIVTGLPAPAQPSDAVTKAYADALALGAASIPDGDIMANTTGGAASPVGTPLSTILDHALATTARGTVIFRGAAGWVALPPGASGQVLKSGGAGADVTWGAGASGVTDIAAGTGISTGGSDITTTGTISLAAIANGSLVANTSGGTAAPVATTLSAMLDAALSATRGAVIYRGNTGWAALLPGTSGKYLKTAGVGADPLWDSPAGAGTVTDIAAGTGISTGGSDITSTGTISLAATADSTFLGNISGASAAPTPSTMTLILDHVFGSAQGDIIVRGASSWGVLAPGTNGQVLTTGGAGANAAWANAPTGSAIADKFLLANTSGGSATASGHSLSDILDYIIASSRGTIVYRGASGWTGLGPGTAGQVLQTGGTTGDPSWTSAGAAGSLAGDSDVSLAAPADKDLLAYVSSASKWENKSLASVMDAIGSTQGDILYRSSSGWVVLAPGSSGQVLQSGGTGANPSWTSAGASGSLAGDSDASITSPADKDFLIFDSASGKWHNRGHATATADLDAMVGDSGSGGTKGLVPAPPTGSAAAGDFLKADGTWAAPASGVTLSQTNAWSATAAYAAGAFASYLNAEFLCFAPVAAGTAGTAWNPSDKDASITLSNSNKTASKGGTTAFKSVRAVDGHLNTGKWYLEFTAGAITGQVFGFGNSTGAITNGVGFGTGSAGFLYDRHYDNAGASTATAWKGAITGDKIALAIDLVNKLVWAQNLTSDPGVWNNGTAGTQNPGTGSGGLAVSTTVIDGTHIVLPMWSGDNGGGGPDVVTINAGDTAFTGTVPSGFTAWGGSAGNTTPDLDTTHWIETGVLNAAGLTGTVSPANGGTGIANNAASTLTITGAFATTLTVSAATNSTLPSGTHTLAGLDVAQTWSAAQTFNSGDLKLAGSTSGTLTVNAAATAGSNTLTLPAGTTDFSATGGAGQVVKQTSSGGALTVGQLATSDLSTVAAAPGAGQLGQEISSTVLIGSAVSLTTGGVSDVASITLTAGVWMVWGNIALSSGGTTNIVTIQGWTSPTSASVPTRPNNGALVNLPAVFTTGTNPVIATGQQVIVVASGTQSVFLTVTSTFNTSTLAAYGFIGAVRIA